MQASILKILAALLVCASISNVLAQKSERVGPAALYAIQVAQMPSQASAKSFANQVIARGYPATVTSTVDQAQTRWWIVTVGKFASHGEARVARAKLQNEMGIESPLPIIQLPPLDSTQKPSRND
jgi:septal ring-binding cell division protein DamX